MAKTIISLSGMPSRSFADLVALAKAPRARKTAEPVEKDALGFAVGSPASAIATMLSAGPTMEGDFLSAAGFVSRADEAYARVAADPETEKRVLAAMGIDGDVPGDQLAEVSKRCNVMANEARHNIMTDGHKVFRHAVTAIRHAAKKDEALRLAVARSGFAETVYVWAKDVAQVPDDFRKFFKIDGEDA